MRLLAFDGRAGASGDMLLAALLAVGADPAVLAPIEDALECTYALDTTTKCGISATSVDVLRSDSRSTTRADADSSEDGADEPASGRSHGDDHPHEDDHRHGPDHPHRHDHPSSNEPNARVPAEGHGPHRSYAEVIEILEEMDLSARVEAEATAIFTRLGEAEASVHGTALESTHFHEVGADDAIADVVGAVALLEDLDPDRIVTTPVAAGGGSVSMSHGEYPVPTPAVVELAEAADWSLRGGPVDRELLTPTGAAILAHVAEGVDTLPPMALEASGYGAGGYDLDPHPNVLRALLGEAAGGLEREPIAVLETNVDDATPEVLGGLQESLTRVGARDVTILPATMKKSRPGHLVKVVCAPADRERVARRLAEETGTLGIRDTGVTHRWIADRRFETVTLEVDGESHEVAVKVASDLEGAVYDVSAEYDDASRVANETGLPIREVLRRAEREVHDELSE